MTSEELKNAIEREKAEIEERLNEIKNLKLDICEKEKQLAELINKERDEKERECINKYLNGLPESRDDAFVVFDKQGNFIKSVDMKEEFGHFEEMEKFLKKEKLYAQALCSFYGRSSEWYDMTLQEQLKNLQWEFNKKGNLKNTKW